MDKKQVIFLFLFTLLSIGMGYLLYLVFFAEKPDLLTEPTPGQQDLNTLPGSQTSSDRTPQTTPGENGLPPTTIIDAGTVGFQNQILEPQKRVQQAVDTSISGITVNANGNFMFYNNNDGKFYRLDASGNYSAISEEIFYNVENVTWSSKENKAVIEYPDGSNILYDFSTKKQTTLPKDWQEFSFSEEGNQIAAKKIGLTPDSRWLVESDPNGTNVRYVQALGENADKVTVDYSPNNKIIASSKTGDPAGAERQEIIFVGRNNENFKSLIADGYAFQSVWSPQGEQILYSVHSSRSQNKPELWIASANTETMGSNKRLLGINTWAEKCAFAQEDFIVCAVPQNLQNGAGFVPEIADTLPHDLVKININTGKKENIPLDQNYMIEKVVSDGKSSILYFTDRFKTGVFRVNL